jgi:hypothetical protein
MQKANENKPVADFHPLVLKNIDSYKQKLGFCRLKDLKIQEGENLPLAYSHLLFAFFYMNKW